MKELTPRQREVLIFITEYISTYTYSPTIRDIADHYEISVKGAYDHVAALKKKGRIKADRGPRTLTVVKSEEEQAGDIVEIPFLGTVAAGTPILAEENWDGSIPLHRSMLKKGRRYFALKVRGDSMTGAGIMDGDTAIIEQQEAARNGEIVIAMVNEAITMKRYFRENTRIRLQPENDAYKPIYSSKDIRILGRVVHIFRSY
jgi:repressor LexA